MNRVVRLVAAVALAGAGCGDDPVPVPLTEDGLLIQLRAVPGVTVEVAEFPPDAAELALEYHYYILHFTQPIDHDDPSQGTFQQQVSLLHRNDLAPTPMVIYTSGYYDGWGYKPAELTRLLAANQVSIEHRYFGTSHPAVTDWSKLSIAQMAADEHDIITALHTIYDGAFLSTGGSKGGMTAMFHRRFFPHDVDGTVAYVAPLSRAASDPAYQAALDDKNTTACRQAVRDTATNMLANHRDELVTRVRAEADRAYTRVLVEPALEAAVASLEWSFWQYKGVTACPTVPTADATVDNLYVFLEQISSVAEYDDANVTAYEPYTYQSHRELGYPSEEPSYLEDMGLIQFTDEDYAGELPYVPDDDDHSGPHTRSHGDSDDSRVPITVTFDPGAMTDIDDFVQHHGDRLLLIYGGGDPWSARPFVLGDATRSAVFIQADGTHRSQIATLDVADRNAALAMLSEWTGVEPMLTRVGTSGDPDPEPESVLRGHALRAGK